MKKGLLIALLVIGIALVPMMSYAQNPTAVQEYSYQNASMRNDTATSKTTIIPTGSIRPGIDKLTAYEVLPLEGKASSEIVIGVFDGTDVLLTGEKLGEKEAQTKTGGSAGERFMRPKKIVNGLVVQQGAFSQTILYFVRQ